MLGLIRSLLVVVVLSLISINVNAEMMRLDFKGSLGPITLLNLAPNNDPYVDLNSDTPVQGYFLINTDASPIVITNPTENSLTYSQPTVIPGLPPIPVPLNAPHLVDAVVNVGQHTFSTLAAKLPHGSEVGTSTGRDQNGLPFSSWSVVTGSEGPLSAQALISVDISSFPPVSNPLDINQTFDLVHPQDGQSLTGRLGITIGETTTPGLSVMAPAGSITEAILTPLTPVPLPASDWLLGSALLLIMIGTFLRSSRSEAALTRAVKLSHSYRSS